MDGWMPRPVADPRRVDAANRFAGGDGTDNYSQRFSEISRGVQNLVFGLRFRPFSGRFRRSRPLSSPQRPASIFSPPFWRVLAPNGRDSAPFMSQKGFAGRTTFRDFQRFPEISRGFQRFPELSQRFSVSRKRKLSQRFLVYSCQICSCHSLVLRFACLEHEKSAVYQCWFARGERRKVQMPVLVCMFGAPKRCRWCVSTIGFYRHCCSCRARSVYRRP